MKSLIAKFAVAALGLSVIAAPAAANAQSVSIGVNAYAPGYAVHARYVNPGGPCYGCGWRRPAPRYYWHPYAYRPVPVAYYNGYYGWAPAGFYGYYRNGGWYHHRRWHGGVWIYF